MCLLAEGVVKRGEKGANRAKRKTKEERHRYGDGDRAR